MERPWEEDLLEQERALEPCGEAKWLECWNQVLRETGQGLHLWCVVQGDGLAQYLGGALQESCLVD